MKLLFIRSAKAKGYLKLRLADGEDNIDLFVSEREYKEAGAPLVRDEILDDVLQFLKAADMRFRARIKAHRVLEYGDNSERMLIIKLRRAGISQSIAEETAHEMVMRGFVNDLRQLKRLVARELSSLVGPSKFIPKLISKGYSKSDIEIALDELSESGEGDVEAARRALIEKNKDLPENELRALLYKRGFTSYD